MPAARLFFINKLILIHVSDSVRQASIFFFRHRGMERKGFGAGNGIRTRDVNLGKVALYH
jgi:hypothetical protein